MLNPARAVELPALRVRRHQARLPGEARHTQRDRTDRSLSAFVTTPRDANAHRATPLAEHSNGAPDHVRYVWARHTRCVPLRTNACRAAEAHCGH